MISGIFFNESTIFWLSWTLALGSLPLRKSLEDGDHLVLRF